MSAELQLDVVPGEVTLQSMEDLLHRVLEAQRRAWSPLPHGDELVDELRRVLSGHGKRLRPRFCHWGFLGAGGDDWEGLVQSAAAVELLHTFALVHDDVMDGSATRRGRATVHARHGRLHEARQWRGEQRRFSEGVAVLVGDLAFTLAHRLAARLPEDAREQWQQTCDELVLGQYLDLRGAAAHTHGVDYACSVLTLKSARYTVVRPLLLGAAVAGGLDEVREAYVGYGEPLGAAFQLRDDLLGVFGNPGVTGKPIGDDLREGKPTVLLALTVEAAPDSAAALLDRVGRPELTDQDVCRLRDLCVSTGAHQEVVRRIRGAVDAAREAVCDPRVSRDALPGLLAMVDAAAWRDR